MTYDFRREARMTQQQFHMRLLASHTSQKVMENGLESVNSITTRYGNEPYSSLEELKRYDPDEYESMLRHLEDKLRLQTRNMKFASHGVECWRALSVPDVEAFLASLPTSKRLGVYWAFEKKGARPYWGSTYQRTVVLYGEMPEESVNFDETAAALTKMALSNAETELQGNPGDRIWINSCLVDKEEYPVKAWMRI